MSITAELSEVARVRVIYGDTDQMGMVYYGNYLRYFEIARNEFLRRAGAPYRAFEETHGLRLPVIEAKHVRVIGVFEGCKGIEHVEEVRPPGAAVRHINQFSFIGEHRSAAPQQQH